jgi:hypothetical protein
MRSHELLAIGCFALVVTAGGGAIAQEEQATSLANLTAPQMAEAAEAQVAEMSDMLKTAFQQLEAARQEQDAAAVTCINDALTPMKGLLKLAERNKIALQDAASRNNRDAASHEAIKISIAFRKVRELEAQVRSCGGPDAEGTVDGKPEIETVIDGDLPAEDPTTGFKDVDVLLERPVSASRIE